MKILIAVPTFENITPDTFRSIYSMDRCGQECIFDFVRGYDCATARNKIVKKMQTLKADCVLMVDNNVVLKPDTLKLLLEDQKDVCLGYYPRRNADNIYDGDTSVFRPGEYNFTQRYSCAEMKLQGDYKIKVHGGGMGCALIMAEVFERVRFPWFKWMEYQDGGILSEDLYFCLQCERAGIDVYCDARAGCGHILRHTQWPVEKG